MPNMESFALTAYSKALTKAFKSLSCKHSWKPTLIHSLISSSVFKLFRIHYGGPDAHRFNLFVISFIKHLLVLNMVKIYSMIEKFGIITQIKL